jgi:adenine C2-methylase RlmN of 23S rRNA A2503 and tRNA A37
VPTEIPEISTRILAAVRRRVTVPRLELVERGVSPTDRFAKYLFRGAGPDLFEAVRIPRLHRHDDPKYVVCVSSQVGCALGGRDIHAACGLLAGRR